ncbi:MAG: anthranilate synthase component I family protein [bacterium]
MTIEVNMEHKYQEFKFEIDLSPFEMFKRLDQHCQNAFILESLGEESAFSRFTYLGAEPQTVVSDATTDYAALKNLLPHVEGLPPHYHGGLVGYAAYDGTAHFEQAFVGEKHPHFPSFEFGLYLDGFIFDKHTHAMRYFTLKKDRRAQFKEMLKKDMETPSFEVKSQTADMTMPQYRKAFMSIKDQIQKGNAFQVVFSVGFEYECAGSPVGVYDSLRNINPSPHMYCMKFGKPQYQKAIMDLQSGNDSLRYGASAPIMQADVKHGLSIGASRYALGASPELLFRTKGREIEHFGTLAGTLPRGRDGEQDARLAAELTSDEKEVAEHMMLVDLARNDVGKVAEFGSVRAEKLMAVKRFSHVQHLSTEVRGTLRHGLDSFDVLAACAPAGTLTGAPKVEAMRIIAEQEKSPRGLYGGSVGYVSVNGDAMFAIAIRSLFVSGNKAFSRSGSGIVYDSVCEKEYAEVMAKQRAMEQAIEMATSDGNFLLLRVRG